MSDTNPWKDELAAIVGARHGGAGKPVVDRLVSLDSRHPNVPEICIQVAWSLENTGEWAGALPWYEKALTLGLSPNEHSGALIGLATCQKRLGKLSEAEQTLRTGLVLFPDNREFDAFLALVIRAQGREDEAFKHLLTVLVETTEDFGIRAYQRSLRHEADTRSPL